MYQLTIWLEIHIKIKSENKLFCQCKNEQNFDTLMPNTNICPVCTGQPGALPKLSYESLWKALLLGKALNCKINKTSTFDRKSYFYPDLPVWYQITQLYHATNTNGQVTFFLDNYTQEKTINIIDAHIETDTAKMIHNDWIAMIDFNRSGTPLVEVVTWPDFTTQEEVVEFLKELQRIVRYNWIADADMEKWQMRADVNISIKKESDTKLGTRVEIKNVNSFWAIKRAIENEYKRQVEIMKCKDNGLPCLEEITQQTRWRNDQKGESYMMRSKEDALDYRYFPEPDLPPLVLDEAILAKIKDADLEIPYLITKKFKEEYGFNKEYINTLINDKITLDYFIEMVEGVGTQFFVSSGQFPKLVAKWISWPISAYMKENFVDINNLKVNKDQIKEFLKIANSWEIMENQLKIVMDEMLQTGKDAQEIIKEKWFEAEKIDTSWLENVVQKVLDANPAIVDQYKWWKTTVLWFFVWQVMKETWWKVNPKVIQEIIITKIK